MRSWWFMLTQPSVAQRLPKKLQDWAAAGQLVWQARAWQATDLQGAFLVIAERSTPAQNAAIYAAGRAGGALVNVNDDLQHCDFIASAVVRQGDLLLTISTSGAAPALAVRLKEKFARAFGAEYALFLHWMRRLRQPLALHHPNFRERKAVWYRVVDSEILRLLRGQQTSAAERRLREIVGEAVWHDWAAAAVSPTDAVDQKL
jgi:precorrin-2 dehydrogenase/sirohydrochlorin ferrochelatase